MIGPPGWSAQAVEAAEAITSASARVHRAQGFPVLSSVTPPVRRSACNSCVTFHGDAPPAGDSGTHGRGRRGGGPARLAVGADWFGVARYDLDPHRGGGAGGGSENCR